MAGLLDLFGQRDPNDPVNMGLLGMSAALGTPVRQGGGVGPAFGAFGQGFQNSQQAEMRRRLMESQIAEQQRTKDFIPVGKNLFNVKTGQFIPLPDGSVDEPAAIREWDRFKAMSPEEQASYLDMKRQNYDKAMLGGVENIIRKAPVTGAEIDKPRPLSTLDIEVDAARRKKLAEAAGKVTGDAAGAADVGLAGEQYDVAAVEDAVKKLKEHPGKKYAVGVPLMSQLPDSITIGGTEHANFLEQYKKAQGGVFLDAYKTLKGGGQITEIEGNKAQQAKAAMGRAQTKEAFDASLDEYLFWTKRGFDKLRKQKALGNSGPVTPQGIRQLGESMVGPKPAPTKIKPASEMSVEEIRAELENLRNRSQ